MHETESLMMPETFHHFDILSREIALVSALCVEINVDSIRRL